MPKKAKTIQINDDGTLEVMKKSDSVKKIKSSKYAALSKDERIWLEKDLLSDKDYVFNQKHIVIFYLMVYAGLRRGEVVQCRKDWLTLVKMDINGVERNLLQISVPYKDRDIIKGGNWMWKAKSKHSERTIIVLEESVSMYLKTYFDANKNGVGFSTDYLYRVVSDSSLRFSFKNRLQKMPDISVSEKKRLEDIKPHALRATYAFHLKEDYNIPNEQIKDLMGHGDSRLIDKHYFERTSQGLLLSIQNHFKK